MIEQPVRGCNPWRPMWPSPAGPVRSRQPNPDPQPGRRFYRDVVADDLLGPVFTDVAEVDWAVHIPKLIDFWCRVLLGHPGYDGYIFGAHQEMHHDPSPGEGSLLLLRGVPILLVLLTLMSTYGSAELRLAQPG